MKEENKSVMTRFGRIVRPVQKYVTNTVLPTQVHATNLKKLLQIENRKEAIQKAIEEIYRNQKLFICFLTSKLNEMFSFYEPG